MPRKFDPAVKERVVRLVLEHRQEYSSLTAATAAVAKQERMGAEIVRKWVRQADVDARHRPGLTSAENAEIKALKAKVRRLEEDNAILKSATVSSPGNHPATSSASPIFAKPIVLPIGSNEMINPPRCAGRPIDPSTHARLLRATQDLLIEVGFDQLTIDAVAKRSRAGKAAVYRRWPSKMELAIAAAADLFVIPAISDSGDLRQDLLAAAHSWFASGDRNQAVLVALLVAGRHHPQLREFMREQLGSRSTDHFGAVILRAVERGVVAPNVDIEIVADIVPTFAFHCAVVLGKPIDDARIVRIIDGVVLPALRHRPARF